MQDDGELDLTSDIDIPRPDRASATGSAAGSGRDAATGRPAKSIRVFFSCCRLYTRLVVPDRVMQGKLKTWRVHCPKCGALVEIPNSP